MKWSAILLALVLLGTLCVAQEAPESGKKQEKKAAAAEARWQGTILRVNKGTSSLSVRGGMGNMESTERQIFFDDSTKWTKQGKPADASEFKEGSFVIVLGHVTDGVFHASRIDLRAPR